MSEDHANEVDLMDQIDRNSKAHDDSSPEEVEQLRETFGDPDANGNFTSSGDGEGGAEE